MHCRRDRDSAGVGAAASECGDVVIAGHTLESADDYDLLLIDLTLDAVGIDLTDTRRSVCGRGQEACLPAGQGDRGISHILDAHRQQRSGDLLARGEEHIHLAVARICGDLSRLFDQVVGGVALSGYDNDNTVALLVAVGNDTGYITYTFGVLDGCTAELHYDQTHVFHYPQY